MKIGRAHIYTLSLHDALPIFKEEYQQIYNEGKIFKDYFFKQRSKMSNFINKPKGKIAQNIIDVYHSTVEYSLECQDLLKELEEKINVNKEDL